MESQPIPSPACNLCGRLVPDDLEIFSLCADCKFLLLQDFGTPAPPPPPPPLTRRQMARRRSRRQRRRRTSRPGSSGSESVSDISAQQFTHMISIARQTIEGSSHTTPTGSTRWRLFSESESEDFDNVSNGSFSLYRFDNDAVSFYGGDSDAEVFERSDIDFDTDIDPMHAGLSQWNSEEDEDGESGTVYRRYLASPSESYSSMTRFDSPELERGFRQRIMERRQALSRNIFTGLEDMELSVNVGDYLDERGFEELLEGLAESDNTRRGAPPASVSCVMNLPRVIVGEEHVKTSLVCAVCKDLFVLGSETTQLPCLHLYHGCCIVPWLSSRNSCPLCRYELPTDDQDYEEGKQNVLVHVREDSSSSDDGTDVREEEEYVGGGESEAGVSSRVSRGRWLFLAAAPVVSLVGVMLAMWLSNPQRRDIVISHSQRENRTRRWLPFF